VRQYAGQLGLNLRDIEEELEAMTPKPVDTVRVDKVFKDYRPANGPVLGDDVNGRRANSPPIPATSRIALLERLGSRWRPR
jgi:hypothetical protein